MAIFEPNDFHAHPLPRYPNLSRGRQHPLQNSLRHHDQKHRFRFSDPSDPNRFDAQVWMAIGCLFCLQGVPVIYYGTEQGLHGAGDSDENVREAFWGKPKEVTLYR